jgi:general secretion pathway protein G
MVRRQYRARAFSLVELVVVVLILGIIAAMAAPRMFDAAGDARQSSTQASLAVLRDAIVLYEAQNGVNPPAATLPVALAPFLKGPFLGTNQNANVASSSQNPIATPEAGGAGWAYNETTGDIVVNQAAYIAW